MRKLMMSILALSIFGLAQVNAKTSIVEADIFAIEILNDEVKEITLAELPKAVKESLKDEKYAGWDVEKVYHVKKDGKEYYKLEVKKGTETTKLKFDKNGKAWSK